MQQGINEGGGISLKQERLSPIQKESLKSVLNCYKTKMVTLHETYLANANTLTKEQKYDFYQHAFSLAFILQKYQDKDNDLSLDDYILEAERIRDHQLYKPSKNQIKFNIMPQLTKEKYESFIEYEKDVRFPQQKKPLSLNTLARQPDFNSIKPQLNQKIAYNQNNNTLNSTTNSFSTTQDINQKIQQQPTSFQPNNNDDNKGNNNGFSSARFINQYNGNQNTNNNVNGFNNAPPNNANPNTKYNDALFSSAQNNTNQNPNGFNADQNGFNANQNGYGRSLSNQDEGQQSSYRNNQFNKYQNNNSNNVGYGRNRFNNNYNNNRFNRGNSSNIEEEEDPSRQVGGGFLTAQQAAKQNQYLKKQKEEGFYNKETGRYGRSQGNIEFEGINDNRSRYGSNNKYNNNNKNVDDVVNMVHYHTLGKNINLNNQTPPTNQSLGICGGGSEDESKKTGLSKKFKPPGAPGSNPVQKKNEGNDQLKGMDQKLVDLIESEIVENAANVKWEDIAGLQSAKRAVHETIVWPMLNPQIFTGIRAPPKGLLLFGPPGTGKTMIGKAIACESGSTFFSISASSLTSKYIGEGEKMVKILFKLALQRQPSVIFIDEIDSLLCARQENENEASRRIKTEFLVQMEGAQSKGDERILLIGATNRPQELDDAVKRRFVKKLYIPLPNKEARCQLINRVIEKGSADGTAFHLEGQDLNEVVESTKGYSGADMRNLCQEAAFIPLRQCADIKQVQSSDIRPVMKADFMQALRQVKATVTKKDLTGYIDWNNQFGSFELNMEEIDT